jgi:PPM family protein phosphatase
VLRACAVSDAGRVRKTNEDAFVADPEARLFAVCDGMGGHKAGEVASRLAVDAMAAFIRRSADDLDCSWPFGVDQSLSVDGNRLRTAIHLANRHVFRTAESTDDYRGMGATVVAALMTGSQVCIGHVGDSRLYVLADGTLDLLTVDDSWATVLAQDPTLHAEDIAHHPMRNVLTNVLGVRDHVDIHLSERQLAPGDVLLLCSDGLHGVVDAETLRDVLAGISDVEAAAQRLVAIAMERGSRDNVTALVVRHEADE